MNRRAFLKTGALIPAAVVLPQTAFTRQLPFAPQPEGWRVYEVTTRVEPARPSGVNRAWLPLPSVEDPTWVKPMGNLWSGNADIMRVYRDDKYGAGMLYAEWRKDQPSPSIEVVSRFAARDRATDWANPVGPARLDRATQRLYIQPTELMPTDGIVRRTAREACRGMRTDVEKARAIYDWVVDNTFRNADTRGCGIGDIRFMLETGDLGGKCADLNALYVGLCRAAGIPARDVYGVRVADSRFGFRSLGKSGDISKAQHCRAEVFLAGYGWVPVDPADVRKVVLEEKPGLTLSDPLVAQVRERLFGAWETNWLPYNFAHDLSLPHSDGPKIGFLMYPQGETANGRLDSLDPQNFRYTITSTEVRA